jgi:hypothetical protein
MLFYLTLPCFYLLSKGACIHALMRMYAWSDTHVRVTVTLLHIYKSDILYSSPYLESTICYSIVDLLDCVYCIKELSSQQVMSPAQIDC